MVLRSKQASKEESHSTDNCWKRGFFSPQYFYEFKKVSYIQDDFKSEKVK